jgi:hypothetical protein
MELILATPDSSLWHEAWTGLVARGFAVSQPCPCCGEDWQYMGTIVRQGQAIEHQFRHRHHPQTQARCYVNAEGGAHAGA